MQLKETENAPLYTQLLQKNLKIQLLSQFESHDKKYVIFLFI